MTQTLIAERVGVQASYLSRVLNDEKAQFSEDQLYRILEVLGFNEEEREFLFLLRTYEMTSLARRRLEIERRIRKVQAGGPTTDLANIATALNEALREVSKLAIRDEFED